MGVETVVAGSERMGEFLQQPRVADPDQKGIARVGDGLQLRQRGAGGPGRIIDVEALAGSWPIEQGGARVPVRLVQRQCGITAAVDIDEGAQLEAGPKLVEELPGRGV